jgi:hypothetical protein
MRVDAYPTPERTVPVAGHSPTAQRVTRSKTVRSATTLSRFHSLPAVADLKQVTRYSRRIPAGEEDRILLAVGETPAGIQNTSRRNMIVCVGHTSDVNDELNPWQSLIFPGESIPCGISHASPNTSFFRNHILRIQLLPVLFVPLFEQPALFHQHRGIRRIQGEILHLARVGDDVRQHLATCS